MYLKYDPTQEEQQAINPQAFSCSTQEELILKKENEIYFKAVKTIYHILLIKTMEF
ncbi:hypothetical protein ACXDBS_001766 [Campylobacter jejuni]